LETTSRQSLGPFRKWGAAKLFGIQVADEVDATLVGGDEESFDRFCGVATV
jgi:hypothetical protein